jgi:hypothetical protein
MSIDEPRARIAPVLAGAGLRIVRLSHQNLLAPFP